MSVQAGLLNFDGKPADPSALRELSLAAAPFGPDGEMSRSLGALAMLYQPFNTVPEPGSHLQPLVFGRGSAITWDGRLDNRDEVLPQMSGSASQSLSDLEIVAQAFEKWDTECFAELVGEWAAVIWRPHDRELILARDYIGVRQLFYRLQPQRITWCSLLAPLLEGSGPSSLCEEYVAGYLARKPDAELTPFREIRSVPPGCWLRVKDGSISKRRFWRFNPGLKTRYRTDAEYEEQYRYLFRQAVRRRLRSDRPLLAALSGGLDSSSIVCMADDIHAKEPAFRVDTLSYYDLSEPDEDDLIHLSKIEQRRGRKGFHLDLDGNGDSLRFHYPALVAAPGFGLRREVQEAMASLINRNQYRVILSGTGGDEMNGQALNPTIPLAELLLHLRLFTASREIFRWGLLTRSPFLGLLCQVITELLPIAIRARSGRYAENHPWISREFIRRYHLAARELEQVPGVRFYRPGARDAVQTITTLSRELTRLAPSRLEQRYPYLDQTLVEFLTSIPFDQLLRSGERRHLMRRALKDIVPAEVLSRRTKVSASRCFAITVGKHWPKIEEALASPLSERGGFIDGNLLRTSLIRLRNGQAGDQIGGLLKALSLEFWLRDISARRLIAWPPPGAKARKSSDIGRSCEISKKKGGECHEGVHQT